MTARNHAHIFFWPRPPNKPVQPLPFFFLFPLPHSVPLENTIKDWLSVDDFVDRSWNPWKAASEGQGSMVGRGSWTDFDRSFLFWKQRANVTIRIALDATLKGINEGPRN